MKSIQIFFKIREDFFASISGAQIKIYQHSFYFAFVDISRGNLCSCYNDIETYFSFALIFPEMHFQFQKHIVVNDDYYQDVIIFSFPLFSCNQLMRFNMLIINPVFVQENYIFMNGKLISWKLSDISICLLDDFSIRNWIYHNKRVLILI